MNCRHTNPIILFAALSRFMCTLAAPLPLPAPQPAPLPPSVAQGLIAVLALGHAGIIGYAIHKESADETLQFVGKENMFPIQILLHSKSSDPHLR